MGIMLGLFNDTISEFTGDPLTEMLNADRAWVIVVVALMMVAVGAAIPADCLPAFGVAGVPSLFRAQ